MVKHQELSAHIIYIYNIVYYSFFLESTPKKSFKRPILCSILHLNNNDCYHYLVMVNCLQIVFLSVNTQALLSLTSE